MSRTPKKRLFTEQFIKTLTANLKAWIEDDNNYWLGSFAKDNHIHRQRLTEIAQMDEDFAYMYELAKQHQENRLVMKAMEGDLQHTMAIFALKNVAGWRDEQHIKAEGLAPVFIINPPKDAPRNRLTEATDGV